jgi:hypothetical protein
MTTVVSRLFADQKTAEQAVTALKLQNHPDANIDMISAGSGAEADMVAARVPEDSAALYAKAMKSGMALVVCRAPFFPAGAARNAMDTMSHFDSVDAGVENENYYIREQPKERLNMDLSVDRTHRYWGTFGYERRPGKVSDAFGARLVYEGSKPKWFGTFAGSPIASGRKFWGTFGTDPVYRGWKAKRWGTFFGSDPVYRGSKPKFFGTFMGEPVLRGTWYFGSMFLPPITPRRGSN